MNIKSGVLIIILNCILLGIALKDWSAGLTVRKGRSSSQQVDFYLLVFPNERADTFTWCWGSVLAVDRPQLFEEAKICLKTSTQPIWNPQEEEEGMNGSLFWQSLNLIFLREYVPSLLNTDLYLHDRIPELLIALILAYADRRCSMYELLVTSNGKYDILHTRSQPAKPTNYGLA